MFPSRRFSFLAALVLAACGGAPPAPTAQISTTPASNAPAQPAPAATPTWSDADSPVPVTSDDPSWGRRDAPVTIVLFSDFQCPFCARVEPTFDQIRRTYGPEKVRIVWKNQPLPFHANALPAATAAQTVFMLKGAEAFWKFHDAAFTHQRELSDDSYVRWAADAGIDPASFKAALASHKSEPKIVEDMAIARKVGANGTPMSFVNGVEISGAQPFDAFKKIIDLELAKAELKIASGTAKDRIYVETSKMNFTAPKEEVEDEEPVDTAVWKVPVGRSPVRGKADAPITIVEFSDFQCPFCKRAEPTIDEVRRTYGDKVRVVWKDEPLPFHPRATPAAELARFAYAKKGQDGFWKVHDALFASQPKLEDSDLTTIAKDAGLDASKAMASVSANTFNKEIQADQDLADDVQAFGTPHFFVNGRRLVGAQPFEKFKVLIDEELKKFDDQKGKVAAKDYYESLMKTAKGAPEPEKKQAPKVTSASPSKGKAAAKVVIQEWSDFQCPFCSRVEPTVAKIMKDYGDRVKFVWRDMPLPMHPDAPLAAEAAREAFAQKGDAGFWKMHEKLFAHQTELSRDHLVQYANEIGLDVAKFNAALDAHTHAAAVDADRKAGSDVGISGTPAFLINGYYVSGAQPYPKFEKLIRRALIEAK